jgi:hypothetical protein
MAVELMGAIMAEDETEAAKFYVGLEAKAPIDLIEDPASTKGRPLPKIPGYTSKEWLRKCVLNWVFGKSDQGHEIIAKRAKVRVDRTKFV